MKLTDNQIRDVYRGEEGKSGYRRIPYWRTEKNVEGFDHTVTQMEITMILTNFYDVFQLK
jgi:hypothetical protein